MNFEEKIFIAITSAILGAVLGVFVKTFVAHIGFRHKIIENIVSRYLDARDSICEIVAECATFKDDFDLTNIWLDEKRLNISKLYYQYYDYIPTKAIHALICFQACLKDRHNRFYSIKDNNLVVSGECEIADIMKSISLLENIKLAAVFNINRSDQEISRRYRIEYQARYTLTVINENFTEENLSSLRLFKPKHKNGSKLINIAIYLCEKGKNITKKLSGRRETRRR